MWSRWNEFDKIVHGYLRVNLKPTRQGVIRQPMKSVKIGLRIKGCIVPLLCGVQGDWESQDPGSWQHFLLSGSRTGRELILLLMNHFFYFYK